MRDIKIIPVIYKVFKNSIQLFKLNPNNLLFCTDKCELISTTAINCAFKRICEKNTINSDKNVNFHMLRHTYATSCIESGMPAKVLQNKLGHQDVRITLNTYTEIFAKYEDDCNATYLEYLQTNKIGLQ